MPTAMLRAASAILAIVVAGCAATPAAGSGGESQDTSPGVHTLVLARGQKSTVGDEPLSVELTAISDSRCPARVTCIWAGHATVTLQVGTPGSAAGEVIIGTEAPANMNLPQDASYAGYRFQLIELTPGNADGSTSSVPVQSATIRVSRQEQ